jgi:hypothetical protein
MQAAWSWSSLFRWQIRIRDLKFGRVSISVTPATGPAHVPASLAVPLGIVIEAWHIDELVIAHAGQQHRVVRIYSRVTDQIAVQAGVGDASSLFLLYTFTF